MQVACDGSNINPVAVNILQLKNPDGSYYVSSSSNGKYQQTTFSIPARFSEHQAIGNIDYVINARNTLTGRWFYSDDPTNPSFWCGSGATPGNCLPYSGASNVYGNRYYVGKLTSVLTNSLVNEARFSLQRALTDQHPTVPFTDTQVGILPVLAGFNSLNQIMVNGAASFSIGANGSYQAVKRVTGWEAADQISWSHGRHTIRAGFEYERDRVNWDNPGYTIGVMTFQSMQDFLLGLPGCTPGNATCSPANPGNTNGTSTSNVSSTGQGTVISPPNGLVHGFRVGAANAFVQDDFKISPRLTMNLGLRWDYNGQLHDKYGNHRMCGRA